MRTILPTALLWGLFALIVGAGAYAALSACDLGLGPLFGYRYCSGSDDTAAAIGAERDRQRDLNNRMHASQVRLAQLPICPPAKTEEPRRDAKVEEKSQEAPPQRLEVPKKISEIEGCWQSASGDISLITDDEERKLVGTVRVCYCFDSSGKGEMTQTFSDGNKCGGPITAQIDAQKLLIQQPAFFCEHVNSQRVRAEIECERKGNTATCYEQNFGKLETKTENEFQRVTKEHCGFAKP